MDTPLEVAAKFVEPWPIGGFLAKTEGSLVDIENDGLTLPAQNVIDLPEVDFHSAAKIPEFLGNRHLLGVFV